MMRTDTNSGNTAVAQEQHPARVLIVEDENIVALDLRTRLERLGYQVCGVVRSGEEAVELSRKEPPDLILMDIMLSGRLDGIETARKIYDGLDVPVIYLTAYADNETVERAKLTDPFGYILKPFDERELQTALKMALYKHRVQKRLKESERNLKTILNSIEEGVIGIDGKERVTFLNPVAESLTGWSQHEALGRPLDEIYCAEPLVTHYNRETDSHQEKSVLSPLRHGTTKLLLHSRKGKNYIIEQKVSALKYDEGRQRGAVVVFRDVTDRDRLENVFREIALSVASHTGDTFFRELVQQIVKVLDVDYAFIGRIVYENQGPTSVPTRVKTLAVCHRGTFLDDFIYDLPGTPCQDVTSGALSVFPHSVQELYPQDPMLRELQIEGYIGQPLRDAKQKPIGILVAMSLAPIEDRFLAENLFRILGSRAEAELERQIREEERRALEAQLQHTQKLESLGILAGGIAHDFNNLLVGILGNAGLALSELPADSPVREIIEQIQQASQQAADLTRQLLAYSGKAKFHRIPIQLNDLIQEMTPLLKVTVPKKIHLQLDFQPELPFIEGDPTQIRQILLNLVTNAAEAIGSEEGVITISTSSLDADQSFFADAYFKENVEPGTYVCLSVSDTGCGMDQDTMARIFDPFFTTKFTGRGLGLASLVGILRGHHGAVKVESAPGEGTVFSIFLPARKDLTGTPSENRASTELTERTRPARILLVDDEEVVRQVTRRILERQGFEVVAVSSGQDALEVFEKAGASFDLVLLDLTMPGMNGIETFHALKEKKADVRVVLTSGYSEDESARTLIEKGLVSFIQKPFHPEELRKKINQALTSDQD